MKEQCEFFPTCSSYFSKLKLDRNHSPSQGTPRKTSFCTMEVSVMKYDAFAFLPKYLIFFRFFIVLLYSSSYIPEPRLNPETMKKLEKVIRVFPNLKLIFRGQQIVTENSYRNYSFAEIRQNVG